MLPVSIIVPAWNEEKVLSKTFQALGGVDYEREKSELIVVAGGEDKTYEVAKDLAGLKHPFSRNIVIPQEGRGTKNAAIQQGIREAKNPVIVLLDADTIVSPRWLTQLVEPIERGECDLAIANSEPIRRNWVSDYFMIIKTSSAEEITTYPGHSLALRADIVLRDVDHFFDESIWMGDDYMLVTRVKEAGGNTMFVRSALVKTHFPCSLRYFIKIETKWLTAFINFNGVNPRTLLKSTVIMASLLTLMPFSWILFTGSLVFHGAYVGKKLKMFRLAAKQYETKTIRLFGFIFLSYLYHVLNLAAHIRYFLGMWQDSYYQGQRG
ncbi:MAG: glycosyltransferase family 2 protein [Thermodesulfobacteriota bacterium]|nr:glycosyltransferase family 2 protein [Thermodesulfobacteriota bacterium]